MFVLKNSWRSIYLTSWLVIHDMIQRLCPRNGTNICMRRTIHFVLDLLEWETQRMLSMVSRDSLTIRNQTTTMIMLVNIVGCIALSSYIRIMRNNLCLNFICKYGWKNVYANCFWGPIPNMPKLYIPYLQIGIFLQFYTLGCASLNLVPSHMVQFAIPPSSSWVWVPTLFIFVQFPAPLLQCWFPSPSG